MSRKSLTGSGGFDDVMSNPLAHMTSLADLDAPAPSQAEPEPTATPPSISPVRQIDSKTERQIESETSSQTASEKDGKQDGQTDRRTARKQAVARARELGATDMKAVGLKVPEGLNDYLDDLQHRLKKRGVLKQDLLRHALQLLVIKVETGGDLGELD